MKPQPYIVAAVAFLIHPAVRYTSSRFWPLNSTSSLLSNNAWILLQAQSFRYLHADGQIPAWGSRLQAHLV